MKLSSLSKNSFLNWLSPPIAPPTYLAFPSKHSQIFLKSFKHFLPPSLTWYIFLNPFEFGFAKVTRDIGLKSASMSQCWSSVTAVISVTIWSCLGSLSASCPPPSLEPLSNDVPPSSVPVSSLLAIISSTPWLHLPPMFWCPGDSQISYLKSRSLAWVSELFIQQQYAISTSQAFPFRGTQKMVISW